MIVSALPKQIILKGLEEYFNTLISNLNPKLPEGRPVKSIEFGVLRSWAVLELSSKEAK
jgi:splicing factor U2AF subunit